MTKKDPTASALAFLQKATTPQEKKQHFKESFEVTKPAVTSGFRGMFGEAKLSVQEEERLRHLLTDYNQSEAIENEQFSEDYRVLSRLTSEIKAISNQSILLHGERIKRAQELLKRYKDGAFTEWLFSTYGNRQTPYSLLQYYEFYHALPLPIRPLMEVMPKKAAYTLASRDGDLEKKLEIIRNYQGEAQSVVISQIKEYFPSKKSESTFQAVYKSAFLEIEKVLSKLEQQRDSLSTTDKEWVRTILNRLEQLLS